MVTPSMTDDGGTNWGQLVLLGNDIAMQWYALAHDSEVPAPQYIAGTGIPTRTYSDTTKLLAIALVVLGVIVFTGRR